MDILIKKCRSDDMDTLRELSINTYYETFESFNTAENMTAYLEGAFNGEKLLRELCEPKSEFFFLYVDGNMAGYMKINEAPSQTDINDDRSLEIERFYLLHGHQGAGLGKVLMDKALSIAAERGKLYVWLGVWEHNEKAKRFYQKQGFYKIGEHAFIMGDEAQTDYVMRKDLTVK